MLVVRMLLSQRHKRKIRPLHHYSLFAAVCSEYTGGYCIVIVLYLKSYTPAS